jgi:two-component sensor histidine kinase
LAAELHGRLLKCNPELVAFQALETVKARKQETRDMKLLKVRSIKTAKAHERMMDGHETKEVKTKQYINILSRTLRPRAQQYKVG